MKDRIKHFDYRFYEIEQKTKIFIFILIIFVIGFLLGYWCKNTEYEDKIYKQTIEIVNLKEQVDRALYQNKK